MWMQTPGKKYLPFPEVPLGKRHWPERRVTQAPVWCSVDLRDGNQALVNPMNRSGFRRPHPWNSIPAAG